jgi:hypothetical protein
VGRQKIKDCCNIDRQYLHDISNNFFILKHFHLKKLTYWPNSTKVIQIYEFEAFKIILQSKLKSIEGKYGNN